MKNKPKPTCFVISVSSGLRLQRVYVTCVTLSCIRFEKNVFQNVLEVQRKILKADQVESQIRLDIEPAEKTRQDWASGSQLDLRLWMRTANRFCDACHTQLHSV